MADLTASELESVSSGGVDCEILRTRIESLSDFVVVVDRLMRDDFFWFRGHADVAWTLVPSALRYAELSQRNAALAALDEFRRIAELKIERPPLPDENLKWVQIAQHYGLPTRLLDWTESPTIGLFFTCVAGATSRPSSFLRRRTSAFSGPFLVGTQWMPDGTKRLISWSSPENGTYLVVDWQCPWSKAAAEAALATAPQVILIDPDADNGEQWHSKFASMSNRVLVVTPEQGWWEDGVPSGITPVWFTFAAGEFTAVGIGADGVRSPDSPVSPEPLRPRDFTPINP